MSTQTGIQSNDELLEFFGKCREGKSRGKYRMIKVIIANEALTLDETKETKGTWKEDWDNFVLRAIDDNEPCYLLYRYVKKLPYASINSMGPDFILDWMKKRETSSSGS